MLNLGVHAHLLHPLPVEDEAGQPYSSDADAAEAERGAVRRAAAVTMFEEWLLGLLCDMALYLVQVEESDESVWAAALSCLLYLTCDRGRTVFHRLALLDVRVLASLLEISIVHGWAQAVHTHLVRMLACLLYAAPHHTTQHPPGRAFEAARDGLRLDVKQLERVGGISFICCHVSHPRSAGSFRLPSALSSCPLLSPLALCSLLLPSALSSCPLLFPLALCSFRLPSALSSCPLLFLFPSALPSCPPFPPCSAPRFPHPSSSFPPPPSSFFTPLRISHPHPIASPPPSPHQQPFPPPLLLGLTVRGITGGGGEAQPVCSGDGLCGTAVPPAPAPTPPRPPSALRTCVCGSVCICMPAPAPAPVAAPAPAPAPAPVAAAAAAAAAPAAAAAAAAAAGCWCEILSPWHLSQHSSTAHGPQCTSAPPLHPRIHPLGLPARPLTSILHRCCSHRLPSIQPLPPNWCLHAMHPNIRPCHYSTSSTRHSLIPSHRPFLPHPSSPALPPFLPPSLPPFFPFTPPLPPSPSSSPLPPRPPSYPPLSSFADLPSVRHSRRRYVLRPLSGSSFRLTHLRTYEGAEGNKVDAVDGHILVFDGRDRRDDDDDDDDDGQDTQTLIPDDHPSLQPVNDVVVHVVGTLRQRGQVPGDAHVVAGVVDRRNGLTWLLHLLLQQLPNLAPYQQPLLADPQDGQQQQQQQQQRGQGGQLMVLYRQLAQLEQGEAGEEGGGGGGMGMGIGGGAGGGGGGGGGRRAGVSGAVQLMLELVRSDNTAVRRGFVTVLEQLLLLHAAETEQESRESRGAAHAAAAAAAEAPEGPMGMEERRAADEAAAAASAVQHQGAQDLLAVMSSALWQVMSCNDSDRVNILQMCSVMLWQLCVPRFLPTAQVVEPGSPVPSPGGSSWLVNPRVAAVAGGEGGGAMSPPYAAEESESMARLFLLRRAAAARELLAALPTALLYWPLMQLAPSAGDPIALATAVGSHGIVGAGGAVDVRVALLLLLIGKCSDSSEALEEVGGDAFFRSLLDDPDARIAYWSAAFLVKVLSRSPTLSHALSPPPSLLTLSYLLPPLPALPRPLSPSPTISHPRSTPPTLSHPLPPVLTPSHPPPLSRTLSHPLALSWNCSFRREVIRYARSPSSSSLDCRTVPLHLLTCSPNLPQHVRVP
ncbi:unnamed protein product [Closterium sp. NIES-53]